MMAHQPTSVALIESVIAFVRDEVTPELRGRTAFNARIAVNVLDIIKRELELAPAAQTAELERLRILLDRRDATLQELNIDLCARIARGEMTLQTEGLAQHLWRVALDNMAIDQPKYSTYQRILDQLKAEQPPDQLS